ncbi:hypothetical protein BpHYR1_001922 [Brachionus plicatilis]|uniref:Uncharacterized protein n=1 Tax=Brachionus plicatilis TaxID=10195 RepID=A0A3M7QFX6_BRAPC|nr:hypothetical protein BpHYR1_001922 [Brachionus plicatilis]
MSYCFKSRYCFKTRYVSFTKLLTFGYYGEECINLTNLKNNFEIFVLKFNSLSIKKQRCHIALNLDYFGINKC